MPCANSMIVACAFRDNYTASGNNTTCNGREVRLHNSIIAWYDDAGVPWVSFRGWATNVTLNRIEAIFAAFECREYAFRVKRNGTLWLNGEQVNEYENFPLCGPLGALAMQAEKNATSHVST